MAHSVSTRELAKFIISFLHEPVLPLPPEPVTIIGAYLEKHEKLDDAASDRLNDELLAMYQNHVLGSPTKYAAFLAILRLLRPAIRTPSRVLQWWDRLIEPILDSLAQEKGLAHEAVKHITDLLDFEDAESLAEDAEPGLNSFAQRLLNWWIEHDSALDVEDVAVGDLKERFVQKALLTLAKKDPKNFFISLDSYIVKKPHRNRALYLLCNFVQSQPPHLHLVIQTPLFGNILQSLQKDSSTATIAVGLVALIMLLPYMPSAMVTYLPTLFNIYARLLFWDRDRLFDPEHTEIDVDADAHNGTSWEKSLFNPDYDGSSIPHLVHYFNILYGLYPINFMDYIRKPQRYLRHANNEEDIDVQASEVRDRSESFRQAHLLHPNFYHLTIESEKTDLSRFIKNEADEVLADCHALLTMERTNHGALRNSSPWPGYESSMPTEEFMQGGQENHVRRSSAASDVAPARGAVSPTLQCPLSVKQESGLDQSSLANDSVPSLSLSHQEAELEEDQRVTRSTHSSNPQLQACAPSRSPGTAGQVAQLRQRNLLLQNDLQFEMYIKQQHMTHIGELRRKQVRQAATEAETQNLVMGNRNMRHRLEESKKAEARIKKESDSRRNMAKKWETDLSTRLKTLREEQKKWSSAENLLKQDLETARADCERLRQLVEAAEERRLKAEQDLEAVDISTDELDRLKKEVERLSVSEREYQGKKLTMQSAIDGAAQAEMRAAQMASDMEAREEQLLQTKSFYDAQILDLNTRLSEAVRSDENKPNVEIKSALEGALAASQAKQSELQRQYGALMRKHTVLQSTLLDMQCELAEQRKRAEDTAASPTEGGEADMVEMAGSPGTMRTKTDRGFSDAEVLSSANGFSPTGTSDVAGADGRYSGRGVQNTTRKDRKDKKDDKPDKKDKKSPGIRGIRGFV